jgi:hypothetical protein
MRKIFLFMNVSLDGYYEDSNHDLSGFHNDFEAFSADRARKSTHCFSGARPTK